MRFSWIPYFCLGLPMGRVFRRFLFFSGVLGFIGCAGVFFNGCSTIVCTAVCRDAMVKQGQAAYLNGEYARSRRIFSRLALRKDNTPLQAAGRYGNVCLDMILAEHAPAFRKAAAQLPGSPPQLSCRVPGDRGAGYTAWSGMLAKALAHGMVLLESERSGILEKLNALYARQRVYNTERLNMQQKIDALGLELAGLEKRNMDQAARITGLLHQITVLEKIDKERQEQRENP